MKEEMGASREYWLGKLSNLNVARTQERGLAPHKPLLLLVVMDLFALIHADGVR